MKSRLDNGFFGEWNEVVATSNRNIRYLCNHLRESDGTYGLIAGELSKVVGIPVDRGNLARAMKDETTFQKIILVAVSRYFKVPLREMMFCDVKALDKAKGLERPRLKKV